MAFDPLVFLPHLMAQPGVLASKLEENSYKGLATRRWQTTECNTAWPPFFFKTREIIIKFVIVLCFRQFFSENAVRLQSYIQILFDLVSGFYPFPEVVKSREGFQLMRRLLCPTLIVPIHSPTIFHSFFLAFFKRFCHFLFIFSPFG